MSRRLWKTSDSASLYKVESWGGDYFRVNDQGNVAAITGAGHSVDLKQLCDELAAKGLHPPLLLRFSDILKRRMQQIHKRFAIAIQVSGYRGDYYGVYPIKVNQQYQVVEEIVGFGADLHWGLEAGSKPELYAALAMLNHGDGIIICNGYKDQSFIELALMGLRLGRRLFIVVEKPNELDLILTTAKRIGVTPLIGVRCRLVTTSNGRWDDSGGDMSKFGLSASELLEAIGKLSSAGMLNALQLLHFHIGSQVPEVLRIKEAMQEAACFYTEICRLGAPIEFVDVGGGLGVNYDGSISNSVSSVDYSLQEYANSIVWTMQAVCKEQGLREPHLISESGRALVAHHSVLIVDVLATAGRGGNWPIVQPGVGSPPQLYRLWETLSAVGEIPDRQALHDAVSLRADINRLFSLGHASLTERALAEEIYWRLLTNMARRLDDRELGQIMPDLALQAADRYFCNFSVFQSLPDAWAIGQIFPAMPIHRLDEEPTQQGILVDITCDSDGCIRQYPLLNGVLQTLPLHTKRTGERYLLGIFLIGAYQEILGDLHNLFGDTHAVHVRRNGEEHELEQIIQGESVADVLDHVQFHRTLLLERMRRQISSARQSGRISSAETEEFLNFYRNGLNGSTYLESNGDFPDK